MQDKWPVGGYVRPAQQGNPFHIIGADEVEAHAVITANQFLEFALHLNHLRRGQQALENAVTIISLEAFPCLARPPHRLDVAWLSRRACPMPMVAWCPTPA